MNLIILLILIEHAYLRYRHTQIVTTGTNEKIKTDNGTFASERQWDCVRSSRNCFIQKTKKFIY